MPVIKTANFILRPYRKGDEISLQKNISDKTIYRNTLSIYYPYTLKDAKNWIKECVKEKKVKKHTKINFAIDINKEVAGGIGLSKIVSHKAEIGYWLSKKYRGRGIMTLAVIQVTKYGLEELKLKRIYGHVFPWNKASMRVLEKAGYKFEGVLKKHRKKRNKFIDSYLFAKVK